MFNSHGANQSSDDLAGIAHTLRVSLPALGARGGVQEEGCAHTPNDDDGLDTLNAFLAPEAELEASPLDEAPSRASSLGNNSAKNLHASPSDSLSNNLARLQEDFSDLQDVPPEPSRLEVLAAALRYYYTRFFYLFDKRAAKTKNQVLILGFFILCITLFMGWVIQRVRNLERSLEEGRALRRYFGLTHEAGAEAGAPLVECLRDEVEAGSCDFPAPEGALAPDAPPYTTYMQGVWLAWSLFIDPSWGVWPDLGVTGLALRAVCMFQLLVGIVYIATIVGIIVEKVGAKMEQLQKGLSAVQERGHTVILGWNNSALTVINELAEANFSEGGGVIVVLAEREKVDMEHELHSLFRHPGQLKGTRVIFRTGSRLHISDLRFAAVDQARSVVALSQHFADVNLTDAEMVQTVMCISALRLSKKCTVVAEVRVHDNEGLVQVVGTEAVRTLSSCAVVGSLMLLFMRNPGLSRVYKDVLGFAGNEFYVRCWEDKLEGLPWSELSLHFPDAVPIGFRRADGAVTLNPPPHAQLAAGDSLIVLAEDEDTYAFVERVMDGASGLDVLPEQRAASQPSVILFAGWRREIALMVLDLDGLVAPGSELYILCELELEEREQQFLDHGVEEAELQNLAVLHRVGSPAVRRSLEQVPIERLTGAIIFSINGEGDENSAVNSDSQCLSILMLLRGLQIERMRTANGHSLHPSVSLMELSEMADSGMSGSKWTDGEGREAKAQLPVLVEILDPRTQNTVRHSYAVWSVAEFVYSSETVSQMLAMISEEGAVTQILEQLVGMTGTQFSLIPAEAFISPSATASFAGLAAELCRQRRMVLCGYAEQQLNLRAAPELVINPRVKTRPRRWRGCQLVVITTDSAHPHCLSESMVNRDPNSDSGGILIGHGSGSGSGLGSRRFSVSRSMLTRQLNPA